MKGREYHLQELQVALSPGDPRRAMPTIRATDRIILDVGCGAGQTLIASHLPPDTVRVGIDVDHAGLLLGRELDPSIQFVRGIGEALPFRSESFDLAVARVSLPYMRTQHALSEICRVVRCGGGVWMTLHHFSFVAQSLAQSLARFDVARAAYRMYVMTNGATAELFDVEFPCPFSGGRVESFQTRRGIERRLRQLGCGDIRMELTRSLFTVTATKERVIPAR